MLVLLTLQSHFEEQGFTLQWVLLWLLSLKARGWRKTWRKPVPSCYSHVGDKEAFFFFFAFTCSQVVLVVKNPPASAGDVRNLGSVPGSGRSPGEGNGNPLQYSCLENAMDRGACWATVQAASNSRTRLKWLRTACTLLPSDTRKPIFAFSGCALL